MMGGSDDDKLLGKDGDDWLFGDVLEGLASDGNAKLYGGAGADRFEVTANSGNDSVKGGSGNWVDVLEIADAGLDEYAGSQDDLSEVGDWVLVINGYGEIDDISVYGDSRIGLTDFGRNVSGEIIMQGDEGLDVTAFSSVESIHWT